jgi:ketosteroid isomerase-like protein
VIAMKKIAYSAATVLSVVAAPAFAEDCMDKNASTRTAASKEIAELHKEWATARKARDVAFLERFYDSDLILNVANGERVSRDADIALFRNGVIRAERIDNSGIEVRVFCDAAIATGIESLKGAYAGNPGEMTLRFINVFERQAGVWRLIAHQSTQIEANAASN